MDNKTIIDEPLTASYDLAVAQAWLTELEGLKAEGFKVASYIKRAKELITQAKELAPIDP